MSVIYDSNLLEKFNSVAKNIELAPPISNIALASWSGAGINKFVHKYYDVPVSLTFLAVPYKKGHKGSFALSFIKKICSNAFFKFFFEEKSFSSILTSFNKLSKFISSEFDVLRKSILSKDIACFPKLLKVIKSTQELNALTWFSLYFDKEFCWSLVKKNKLAIKKERFDLIWDKISFPYCFSLEKRRRLILLKKFFSEKSIEDLAYNYCYFYQNYDGYNTYESALKSFKEEFGNLTKDLANKEIKLLEQEKSDLKSDLLKAESSLLNEDEKKLLDFIQLSILIRDERKDFISMSLYLQYLYYDNILNLKDKSIMGLTLIEDLTKTGKLNVPVKLIERRKNEGVFLLMSDGSIHVNLLKDYEYIKEILNSFYLKQNNKEDIRGSPAFKGIVKGVVRIVFDPKEEIFKEGEILVTGMTRPEFVPYMKKALGIITDEGGITCHAAIISREIKKPCVVGTKYATKFLKTGDLIELDANKGIVKKLAEEFLK